MTSPAQATERARPRGRPRRAEATEAILGATLELLAEPGFASTTMDGIAERAGSARRPSTVAGAQRRI